MSFIYLFIFFIYYTTTTTIIAPLTLSLSQMLSVSVSSLSPGCSSCRVFRCVVSCRVILGGVDYCCACLLLSLSMKRSIIVVILACFLVGVFFLVRVFWSF
jgi:hypothetical protein